jgi:hypothetical protein
MALDLFVNFERTANGPVFYRNTEIDRFPVTIKLLDLDFPNKSYQNELYAEVSVNNSSFIEFVQTPEGKYEKYEVWDREAPTSYVVKVRVYEINKTDLIKEFVLEGKFINEMPLANFLFYPKHVPYLDSKNSVRTKLLNTGNYLESTGATFYGEGHTETFHLSSIHNTSANVSVAWFVGNYPDQLIKKAQTLAGLSSAESQVKIRSDLRLDLNDAYIELKTEPGIEKEYPVSMFVWDNVNIKQNSPIIAYNDLTGEPYFYNYFFSTHTPLNGLSTDNYALREPIKVITYETPVKSTLLSQLSASPIYLPIDSSVQTIESKLDTEPSPYPPGILPPANAPVINEWPALLKKTFVGSEWSVKAQSKDSAGNITEWGLPGDPIANTPVLIGATAYNFPLAYDNVDNDILDYFTASSSEQTTITLSVTSYKEVVLASTGSGTWLPRRFAEINEISSVVNPLPVGRKLYTPHYYNLINTPVFFQPIIDNQQTTIKINAIEIFSNLSSKTLILTSAPFTGFLAFDQPGAATVGFAVSGINTRTKTPVSLQVQFDKMIEIVERYDDISSNNNYYTDVTDITLPYTVQPKISPNEWVTADNVNSLLLKIFETSSSINSLDYLYENKFCWYGWLGLQQDGAPLVWQDAECSATKQGRGDWTTYECALEESCRTSVDIDGKTWEEHICPEPDLDCLGRHCVKWKWGIEKNKFGDSCITWQQVSCLDKGQFQTKWKNDIKCELVSGLNCIKGVWKTCSTDSKFSLIDSCIQESFRCNFKTILPAHESDNLVLVYGNELHLVASNYEMTTISIRKFADDTTEFQNIVGAAIGSLGDIVVLDSVLSRVSIFRLKDNIFQLTNTWGKFGTQTTIGGMNNPTDIHVDSKNTVWIADHGNKCIKKFGFNGKALGIITHKDFETDSPKSVCVDSDLHVHVLLKQKVLVFDYDGTFLFQYVLPDTVKETRKINTNYSKEAVYITFDTGVVKYFKTGIKSGFLVREHVCGSGNPLNSFNAAVQDKYRTIYITAGEKVLKVGDIMRATKQKSAASKQILWDKSSILINKNEFVQPWVYLKSFHRLWDNIELVRSSLFYTNEGCTKYYPPVYAKTDLVLGQNELVTNAVINRLAEQLWANLKTLFVYFDKSCRPSEPESIPLASCCKAVEAPDPRCQAEVTLDVNPIQRPEPTPEPTPDCEFYESDTNGGGSALIYNLDKPLLNVPTPTPTPSSTQESTLPDVPEDSPTPTPTPTLTPTPQAQQVQQIVWSIQGLPAGHQLAYADSGIQDAIPFNANAGGYVIPATYNFTNAGIAPTDVAFVDANKGPSTVTTITHNGTQAALGSFFGIPWISLNPNHAFLMASVDLKTIINAINQPGVHQITLS